MSRARVGVAAACVGLLAAGLLALSPPSAPGPVAGEARAQAPGCNKPPRLLAPGGRNPVRRFTMIIRVKALNDIPKLADTNQPDGGIPPRLRQRDIFLINTRRRDVTPDVQAQMVAGLRQRFPCNRIYSLTGLSFNPASPSWQYALYNHPAVSGLLLDWEGGDWGQSRTWDRGIPRWTERPRATVHRIRSRVRRVVRDLRRGGVRKRVGLAPAFYPDWDYASIGRAVHRVNRRFARRPGVQSIQVQEFCRSRGLRPYRRVTRRLLRAYKRARLPIRSLALQVSFTDEPTASAMPVLSVPAWKGARCTRAALRQGGRAFLFWARPEAMRAFLARRPICWLRPPPGGRGLC